MTKDVAAEPGLSYEVVLEAVQESSRGRWFLNEFKSRNSREDTRQILGAIARLDARMESLPGSDPSAAADLAKVRQAIASTREDILKIAGAAGLSHEGKLFAHLAEMARKAMAQGTGDAGSEAIPHSIVKALRLVDQIDASLGAAGAAPTTSAEKYFHRDNDLFQPPAAPAKPVLVASETKAPEKPPLPDKPAVETPVLGAKLVISRAKVLEASIEKPQQTIEPAPTSPPPVLEAETASIPSADAEFQGHPRIVIIRRNPEDMPAPSAEPQLPAENAA